MADDELTSARALMVGTGHTDETKSTLDMVWDLDAAWQESQKENARLTTELLNAGADIKLRNAVVEVLTAELEAAKGALASKQGAADREIARLDAEVAALTLRVSELGSFDRRCADFLADEVAVLIKRKVISERCPPADALLDYRNPPTTPRSDRLHAAEARAEKAEAKLGRLEDVVVKWRWEAGSGSLRRELIRIVRERREPLADVPRDANGSPVEG